MVHISLQGPIAMREGLATTAKAHIDAEVVPSLSAVLALRVGRTRHAWFDGDALADAEVGDARAERGDDSRGLVPEYQRSLQSEVTVPTVRVVVVVRPAQARAHQRHLRLAYARCMHRSGLEAEVFGAMKHRSVLERRHRFEKKWKEEGS